MILHVDLNSFFARVEQQTQPQLRNKPIGILGKGHKGARTCICAASPEAKRFGIKSGFSVWEARRLCPKIILVAPDYAKYLDVSRQFMAILGEASPWVEIFSIDEAFIDLNRNTKSEARNSKLETNEKFENNKSPIRDVLDLKNADLKNCLGFRTSDFEFFNSDYQEAINVALQIKRRMRQELGELITASIGIAWGKVFAKLAGELQKPDGLVVLEKNSWLDRVGTLPASEVCGIGRRLEEHLRFMGIHTLNDLSRADAGVFVARFGPAAGMRLWQIGQGIDTAIVNPSHNLAPAKSIGHQVTLDRDWRLDQLEPMITKLTAKVGRRLRRSTQRAGELIVHLALSSGGYTAMSMRCRPGIDADSDLLRLANRLLHHINLPAFTAVRRVGVTSAHLSTQLDQMLPLFPERVREEQLTRALDVLRDRYGENVVEWGQGFGKSLGNLRDWRGPRAVLDQ